jgi:putative aldouronate transport system permease protein
VKIMAADSAKRASKLNSKISIANILINLFFILGGIGLFIIPFIYILSASFTGDDDLVKYGYQMIPVHLDTVAYRLVFANPNEIINSYIVTSIQAFGGCFVGLIMMAMCAYSLSRSNYKFRNQLAFYIFFTMVFSGGLIPSYIINSQYLHLRNTIWIYIFTALVYPFYLFIIRTFFQELPPSLAESAKVDGASELRILFQIILPLSKPVLATVALLTLLDRWNNWQTALYYITNPKLNTLQFLLQRILLESQAVQNMMDNPPVGMQHIEYKMPVEGLRYAMCVVAAGPMLVIFPFFQKYFSRGLTVGAIKG